MSWLKKSLLISICANALFLAAAWFWFVLPLTPGLWPAFKVCSVLDPGNQPYLAPCSDWHGSVASVTGVILNVCLYWGAIWLAGSGLRGLALHGGRSTKQLH